MSLEITITTDLATCLELRRLVFVEEQGVSLEDERDALDADAIHLLATSEGKAIGCARLLINGDIGKIGRVCILPGHRGTGLGKALIKECLDVLAKTDRVTTAKLGAQIQALGFYQSLGFVAQGPIYNDAGIAHRDMVRPV